MAYAKRLTKEELIKSGIEIKIEAGHLKVYRNGKECKLTKIAKYYVSPKIYCNTKKPRIPYYTIAINQLDENGNRIKIYPPSYKYNKWVFKTKLITLQRAVWAWYHDEVPTGMTVDHINNKHSEVDDYLPSNLQLLTPGDNVRKDSKQNKNRMVKCHLKKPLSHYEAKLAEAEELHKNSTGYEKHKYVNMCALYRAKIKYWKAHHEEAN